MGLILAMGFVTFFNFMILKYKVEAGRYPDAILDALTMFTLAYIFGGSISGMLVAMVAGMLISLYLLVYPPEFMGGSPSGNGNDIY